MGKQWNQWQTLFWGAPKSLQMVIAAKTLKDAKSNKSILKETKPKYSLAGLMLKLKLQYWCKELTHLKRPWCWKRLKARGEGDNRGWDSWMASLTQWTWVWVKSGRWWWTGRPVLLQSAKSQTWLGNWNELNWKNINEDLNRWRFRPWFWLVTCDIITIEFTPSVIHKFNIIPSKSPWERRTYFGDC